MASMHRRTASEARRFLEDAELSDLSDPEFFELDGINARRRSLEVDTSLAEDTREEEVKTKPKKYFTAAFVRASVSLLCWYGFSISLSVYNKYMFSAEGMDFTFPILTTSLHQLVQIVLSLLALGVLRLPMHYTLATERYRVIPAGLASAADIGLGNTSLLIVTLSFYTMIKSSALGFVLLFSVLFRIESPSWRLALIICIMTVGVFLMVAGEADFQIVGFFLVLGASCASGLRWALVKLVLSDGPSPNGSGSNSSSNSGSGSGNGTEPGTPRDIPPLEAPLRRKPHPVQTILLLAPIMFVTLLVWGLIVEGVRPFIHSNFWKDKPIALGVLYALIPGVLAFLMTWAEFELLNVTGPLTLAVAGICKEVATILVSILIFHDKISAINGVGLGVTIVSIGLYHWHRFS